METDRPIWRSRAWLGAVAVLLALVIVMLSIGVNNSAAGTVVFACAAIAAALVIGWTQLRLRTHRKRYEEELATWAAERATQAERLRIAADLHDLVSHGLGLITVRAAAALSVTGAGAPREQTSALADIEHASRETTTELRRMLTVLRDPGGAPLRPADTLADLPAIVQLGMTAGLTTSLDVHDLGDVSPGVQLTVCAVVRGSLNNTLRHAGPTSAQIEVHRDGQWITVRVQDAGPQGPWRPHPGAGHGLAGLRERVSALGGTLTAEPTEPGFQVLARIPDRPHTSHESHISNGERS